jgi:hypothetical protein
MIGGIGDVKSVYLRGITSSMLMMGLMCPTYNHNAHGDVVAMSNVSGTVVKTYSYDAFVVEQDR